jgi:hypothetical protein
MRTIFLAGIMIAVQMEAAAQSCDRACLHNMITNYLNAVITHNPESLPLAVNVRFTEDTVEHPLGEGLWSTATRLRSYRQEVLDVAQGTAGVYAVVEEHDKPALLLARLRVSNRKITEIETVVTRGPDEGLLFDVDALQNPSPEMIRPLSEDQRNTRDEAIRIAMLYPEGLRVGSFVTAKTPFARNAYRLENGRLMAGLACTFAKGCNDIKNQRIPTLSEIKTKVEAVDEEMGIVWLRMDFGAGSVPDRDKSLIVWDMFKVYGGQIHAVEAFMEQMPRGSGSGWN